MVVGTAGDDFIHVADDGLFPPPGYIDTPAATDGDDVIDPGGGTDIVYCGDGNDTVIISNAVDVNGLDEFYDGGAGTNYIIIYADGLVDISDLEFVNFESIGLFNTSSPITLKMSPEQISSISGIAGNRSLDHRIQISAPGDVVMQGADAYLTNVTRMDGSVGNDNFLITSTANPGFLIAGQGGDDNVSFTLTHRIKATYFLDGGEGDDVLTGANAFFNLSGGEGDDVLNGAKKGDTLDGGIGGDRLTGGKGADILTGGGDADRFIFKSAEDSGIGASDTVMDFSSAEGDLLDLRKIDASSKKDGDQAFHLAGDSFTHHFGELIQFADGHGNTILQGDTNGDGLADFQLTLVGAVTLTDSNFLL